jgi:hypothetical protein
MAVPGTELRQAHLARAERMTRAGWIRIAITIALALLALIAIRLHSAATQGVSGSALPW